MDTNEKKPLSDEMKFQMEMEKNRAEENRRMEQWRAEQAAATEKWRADTNAAMETWRMDNTYRLENGLEMLRSAITFAVEVLRALVLINGGAAIAILAMLGKENPSLDPSQAAGPLWYFGAGVVAGVVATGVAYLAQIIFTEGGPRLWGNIFRGLCVILSLASVALFCWGGNAAYKALSG